MIEIDASYGEGGGQILRSALSLSVALQRPISLRRIRAGRPKPGLRPQHLTVVRALASISAAEVEGDALDSAALTFSPRRVRGGAYRFDVGETKGSAGSVSLLFQALLLPLAFAEEPSRLTLVGGTHVPWSPPVHYLTDVFLPPLRTVGVRAEIALRRWGWYPRGGGEIEATVQPAPGIQGLRWERRPATMSLTGVSAVSRLPRDIAERQRARALERLQARGLRADIAIVEDATALGPGTFIMLAASGQGARAAFSALGRRGVRAESIADEAVEPLLDYLDSGAAVDDHLADQLVPFLALARGASAFTCPSASGHLRTVAWAVRRFLPATIEIGEGRPARVEIKPSLDSVTPGRC